MANTISISMSMTTNLMLDDFVTFFLFSNKKIGSIEVILNNGHNLE